MGTLFDNIILTPDQVDEFMMIVEGRPFTYEMLMNCRKMEASLKQSKWYDLIRRANHQQVVTDFHALPSGITIARRCKFDFKWTDFGGDLKSTAAKTQEQFEHCIWHFGYHVQRAWYMDIAGHDEDLLIAVSKHYPYKVFHKFIRRDDELHTKGVEDYTAICEDYVAAYGSNVKEV
jgi:hypothetical protein